MSEDQRKMIRDVHFDGLLKIECSTIPAEFANLLMVECFNADTSELVLPGRGRISVTTQSIADILHLPSKGAEVKYELDVDAINFIHKYDILQGSAPKIDEIIKRIKNNKDKNEDFLKSQLMIAVLTFLCPPTSFRISPRCYPSLVDVSRVKKLNWCQFVVNQLKVAAKKINTKNSVKGCILLLVVSLTQYNLFFFPYSSTSFFCSGDLILCIFLDYLCRFSNHSKCTNPCHHAKDCCVDKEAVGRGHQAGDEW
jgi:hypothetical protein